MNGGQTRRHFLHRAGRVGLGAAGLALLGGCAVSPGQGPGSRGAARVATVGYFRGITPEIAADEVALLSELQQGLRELGWVEGENLRFEVRLGQDDLTALPDLVADLARTPVDVIVTLGRPNIEAVVEASGALPVVMLMGSLSWPGGDELAASIQRPGGNVTGVLQPPLEIFGKRLELLVEAVPHASRIAYLGPRNRGVRRHLSETASALGVEIRLLPATSSERQLELALEAITREATDAMLVGGADVVNNRRARIAEFAADQRFPAMFDRRESTVAGGLMSYNVSFPALYRQAASYVDRILRGAIPGELPIQMPSHYNLVLNLSAARALGLTLPPAFLAQVDEVIE